MSTDKALLTPDLLARLEAMELVSRKIFRGRMKGERRSRRKGQSVEFADFRNYVPGDDVRFVDWNTYARLDRLFLKMFMEEEDLHFYALVDASESMNFGTPAKIWFAKQLAAALGFIGLVRGDRVKIQSLNPPPGISSPVLRGRRSLWKMLDHLTSIESDEPVSLADATRGFALRNSGKGIVVLISDLMDKTGYEAALRYLLAHEWDIYVIHVLSAEELKPELAGDLRLIDCEDADEAEVTVSAPLIKRYNQTLTTFIEKAREFCILVATSLASVASAQRPLDRLREGWDDVRPRGELLRKIFGDDDEEASAGRGEDERTRRARADQGSALDQQRRLELAAQQQRLMQQQLQRQQQTGFLPRLANPDSRTTPIPRLAPPRIIQQPTLANPEPKIVPNPYASEPVKSGERSVKLGVTVKTAGDPENPQGLVIDKIDPNGAAAQSGLRRGDIIVSVGGIKAQYETDLTSITGIMRQGDQIEFEIERRGKARKVLVQFGELPKPATTEIETSANDATMPVGGRLGDITSEPPVNRVASLPNKALKSVLVRD